ASSHLNTEQYSVRGTAVMSINCGCEATWRIVTPYPNQQQSRLTPQIEITVTEVKLIQQRMKF
uniref:E3 ubiquitin-protein ligase SHPRH n=2 Tax=Parascaris univalens TaxID=6257 RepID=A0A915AYL5_PARUN